LRSVGHLVACAGDAVEAQTLLDGNVELIIISLSMPNCDPLRLVSRYRANEASRQLPILLIAEDIDLIRVAKGLVDLGANDYLIRPVDRNELLARTATQVRRKRLQDRLQQNYQRGLSLALTDPLTNLYVRRYGEAHLDELMGRVNQDVASAAVLLFDVDHFKQVNDTHGHDAGDDVLRELAARTIKSVRSVDLAVRWGGEEFLVVMPETDLANAAAVAERLRATVAKNSFAIGSDGEKLAVTISVGVAAAIAGGDNRDRLLKRADDALYSAKSAGRNRVAIRSGIM